METLIVLAVLATVVFIGLASRPVPGAIDAEWLRRR
jgi:hypothetical protein